MLNSSLRGDRNRKSVPDAAQSSADTFTHAHVKKKIVLHIYRVILS